MALSVTVSTRWPDLWVLQSVNDLRRISEQYNSNSNNKDHIRLFSYYDDISTGGEISYIAKRELHEAGLFYCPRTSESNDLKWHIDLALGFQNAARPAILYSGRLVLLFQPCSYPTVDESSKADDGRHSAYPSEKPVEKIAPDMVNGPINGHNGGTTFQDNDAINRFQTPSTSVTVSIA
jgi:hypothetical protein